MRRREPDQEKGTNRSPLASRTQYNAPRKTVANLVVFIWGKIQENPYLYPTVRLLISNELRAINREHQDYIVVLDFTALYKSQIVGSAQDVVPDEVGVRIIVL